MLALLRKLLLQLFAREIRLSTPTMDKEQRYDLMSKMWQNHSVRLFLDTRERFLRDNAADALTKGNVPDAKFTAGRIVEIQNLRNWMKACYTHTHKEREKKVENKRVLTRGSK